MHSLVCTFVVRMQLSQVFSQHAPPVMSKYIYIVINVYLIKKGEIKINNKIMFIYMIYLCCYVSSRRPSDVGQP